jgi:hypothetical protein
MIANCPNLVAVAWSKGAGTGLGYGAGGGYGAGYGAGAGCGAGSGLGFHALAGGCKAACGSVFGLGLLPLGLVAAVGYLGYKVYTMSKNDGSTVPAASAV